MRPVASGKCPECEAIIHGHGNVCAACGWGSHQKGVQIGTSLGGRMKWYVCAGDENAQVEIRRDPYAKDSTET